MKRSSSEDRFGFTMVELVFVIVMVGILSAIIIPRMRDSRLREGIDQVVSHIRYTQHLAMMDDKFSPDDANWYKKRWQILFEQDDDDLWTYTIFSDGSNGGALDGNPAEVEIAGNPQDISKRLTGGSTFGAIDSDNSAVTKDLNLGKTYSVVGDDGIKFTGCGNRIAFDYIGRPMSGNIYADGDAYPDGRLIKTLCIITITDKSGGSYNVTIQPETGFADITSNQ
jgi:prepilin-type N-terminal cleavage/methylation domain-containing protein